MRWSTEPPPSIEPSREELKHLAALHSILSTLNDNTAGVNQLVRYLGDLPALAARVLVAARREARDRDVETVEHGLSILGNRGFEGVLLDYLEALTILKSDLEDEQRAR
jgi:hypothetical protein